MLRLLEVYKAIQGEGTRIGEPSIFVRFMGCNARCAWCDTAYSISIKLHEELKGPPIDRMTPEQVLDAVTHLGPSEPVVLTGGEPTIQPQADLQRLIYLLAAEQRRWVTIETNGTIFVPPGVLSRLDEFDRVLWSLSPKTPSAHTEAWSEKVMELYLTTYSKVQMKFVVSDSVDWWVVKAWYERFAPKYPHMTVIIQPNGYDERPYADRLAELNEWVKDSGYAIRVLPQLHVITYGHQRLK